MLIFGKDCTITTPAPTGASITTNHNSKEPRLFSALLLFSCSLKLSYLRLDPTLSRRASPKSPSDRGFACSVASGFLLSWRLSMTSKPSTHQDHLLLVDCSRGQTASCTHSGSGHSLLSFVFVCSSSRHWEREIVVNRTLCDLDYILWDFVFWHFCSVLLHILYHIGIIIAAIGA